jgi:chromosome segregation ATPase
MKATKRMQIMKHTPWMIVVLSVTALAAGCNREPTASQQLDKIETETKAAAKGIQDYTFAQRTEFVATMQTQLDALNKDLDQLSAKIESSSDAVKAEARPKLQALRNQMTQLNQQLDNVRNANESTWASVKATSQKAFDSLKDGFQESRQWVSDKIAP